MTWGMGPEAPVQTTRLAPRPRDRGIGRIGYEKGWLGYCPTTGEYTRHVLVFQKFEGGWLSRDGRRRLMRRNDSFEDWVRSSRHPRWDRVVSGVEVATIGFAVVYPVSGGAVWPTLWPIMIAATAHVLLGMVCLRTWWWPVAGLLAYALGFPLILTLWVGEFEWATLGIASLVWGIPWMFGQPLQALARVKIGPAMEHPVKHGLVIGLAIAFAAVSVLSS